MEKMVLQAKNLTKSFDQVQVFSHLDLELHQGETLCLTGPSGIGKTTLFHILSGLILPDEGQVILQDSDITGKAGAISYMQQKDLLLPYYTVVKNVALPLIIAGEKPKIAMEQAAKEFAFFGLEGCENQYPSQLSGGMRQRAALLRTYMQSQNVVLLDEPFGALDAITRKKMQQWYMELSKKLGLSTIIVTHDTDEALLLADKILVMNGSPATITGQMVLEKPKTGQSFGLVPEFLRYKAQLLAMLDESAEKI